MRIEHKCNYLGKRAGDSPDYDNFSGQRRSKTKPKRIMLRRFSSCSLYTTSTTATSGERYHTSAVFLTKILYSNFL